MKPATTMRITGLEKEPVMPKKLAMEAGYAILDEKQGRILISTVRSSRSEAWSTVVKSGDLRARLRLRKAGFRSVPVTVREYER